MIEHAIIIIALSWILVKTLKTIIGWVKHRRIDLKIIFQDGGMPSMHTVLIVSLATAMILETGLSAPSVISIVLALIVINDSFKVRRVTGEQSRILNQITKSRGGNMDYEKHKKLSEHIGHTPAEVLVGLILGILIPIIIYIIINAVL